MEWSSYWQLGINTVKCNVLHLGSTNPKFNYTINEFEILSVNHVRDLGVIIDESLKFNFQVQSIVSKAYQRLGILFRGFTSRDPVLLTRAYTTFVRPVLEYCSVVWSPYLLKDLDAIEGVQRYFTRRIYSHRSFTYHERLRLLGLESLEVRRLRFDLIMCFKIIHNMVDLDKHSFFKFSNDSRTRGHSLKLVKPFNKNVQFDHFFCNRVVDCWNSLPIELVTCETLSKFKGCIKKVNLDKFLKGRALVTL